MRLTLRGLLQLRQMRFQFFVMRPGLAMSDHAGRSRAVKLPAQLAEVTLRESGSSVRKRRLDLSPGDTKVIKLLDRAEHDLSKTHVLRSCDGGRRLSEPVETVL